MKVKTRIVPSFGLLINREPGDGLLLSVGHAMELFRINTFSENDDDRPFSEGVNRCDRAGFIRELYIKRVRLC